MTTTYRGFAPLSSKASLSDTLNQTIIRLRETTDGPITAYINPADIDNLQPLIGVTLIGKWFVPTGCVYIENQAVS